jgi:hypothetical protein
MSDDWTVVTQTMDDRPHPTCDFCGAAPMSRPCRAYPADTFIVAVVIPGVGERVQEYPDDGWCACANCWPSVEAGNLEGLLAQLLRVNPDAARHVHTLAISRTIWASFFAHQSGPGIDHDPDTGPPVWTDAREA